MNTKQLRIALEVAECGSISRAAHNLFLSQPSASSNIQALEDELGYRLFYRASTGMVLTELGEKFLVHAKRMLQEADSLARLRETERAVRLRLGMLGYAPAAEAFLRFLELTNAPESAELSLVNIPAEEGLRALIDAKLDILSLLVSPLRIEEFTQRAAGGSLAVRKIATVPLNINLRRGHPLLERDELDMAALRDYPYVDYEWIPGLTDIFDSLAPSRITYKYRIAVDERDIRCRVVATTDAFSVGCKLPDAIMRRYDMVSVPIEGASVGLYCVFRSQEDANAEINLYIKLLEEQMENMG